MSNATVTFAIPFRGRLEHLRTALESVRAQSDSRWQAIVVDDANPEDGAGDLVASFADARMSCTRNERALGLVGNWNRCLDLAQTPLVTLLHCDDALEPHYAATMIDAHARWPDAGAVFCDATIVDTDDRPIFSLRDRVKRLLLPDLHAPFVLEGEPGLAALLRGNFIICPTVCYRRTALGEARFAPDFRWVPDLAMHLDLLLTGRRLVGLPVAAYRYRRHAGQATARLDQEMAPFEEEATLWDRTGKEAAQRGWHRAAAVAAAMRMVRLRLAWYGLTDLAHRRVGPACEKLALAIRPRRPADARHTGRMPPT